MRKTKTLVIEDNLMNMELICEWLMAHDHEVLPADNAPDGIEMARREDPDLVLMDIALPGMDGLEATKILKSDEATAQIPIIAVTASSMRVDLDQLAEIGCTSVVLKPIEFEILQSRIAEALSPA